MPEYETLFDSDLAEHEYMLEQQKKKEQEQEHLLHPHKKPSFESPAPTADMVEVVRCKNCAYWENNGLKGRCDPPTNGLIYDYTDADDFCSFGKRKDPT